MLHSSFIGMPKIKNLKNMCRQSVDASSFDIFLFKNIFCVSQVIFPQTAGQTLGLAF